MQQPPDTITCDRIFLRRWRPDDAVALHPVLDANVAHLEPWIPWAVAAPAPVAGLRSRLAGYADDFDAARAWLYGIFARGGEREELLGGAGIYPRDATRRVPAAAADRAELGYWLRADATGRGYATEAARALMDAALALPFAARIEIRCDPRNDASAAVPRRLGFRHAATFTDDAGQATMLWEYQRATSADDDDDGWREVASRRDLPPNTRRETP